MVRRQLYGTMIAVSIVIHLASIIYQVGTYGQNQVMENAVCINSRLHIYL